MTVKLGFFIMLTSIAFYRCIGKNLFTNKICYKTNKKITSREMRSREMRSREMTWDIFTLSKSLILGIKKTSACG